MEERAKNRIRGWKYKVFNQARKEVLKFVVSAISVYTMSCFIIPPKNCESINAI